MNPYKRLKMLADNADKESRKKPTPFISLIEDDPQKELDSKRADEEMMTRTLARKELQQSPKGNFALIFAGAANLRVEDVFFKPSGMEFSIRGLSKELFDRCPKPEPKKEPKKEPGEKEFRMAVVVYLSSLCSKYLDTLIDPTKSDEHELVTKNIRSLLGDIRSLANDSGDLSAFTLGLVESRKIPTYIPKDFGERYDPDQNVGDMPTLEPIELASVKLMDMKTVQRYVTAKDQPLFWDEEDLLFSEIVYSAVSAVIDDIVYYRPSMSGIDGIETFFKSQTKYPEERVANGFARLAGLKYLETNQYNPRGDIRAHNTEYIVSKYDITLLQFLQTFTFFEGYIIKIKTY